MHALLRRSGPPPADDFISYFRFYSGAVEFVINQPSRGRSACLHYKGSRPRSIGLDVVFMAGVLLVEARHIIRRAARSVRNLVLDTIKGASRCDFVPSAESRPGNWV